MKNKNNQSQSSREYWNNYYHNHRHPFEPSSFAVYVKDKYLTDNIVNGDLIELGCGNGRDSIFLASDERINVHGVDQIAEEIRYLSEKYEKSNLSFFESDFTQQKAENNYNWIYSRFVFHAISEEMEDRTLKWIRKTLRPGGLFFLEARSKKDEKLEKAVKANHYRRFLDFNTIQAKIQSHQLTIIEAIEEQNLAVYENENPYIIRLVAQLQIQE